MTQFSFPTVDLQGIGPCVTRRVLMERAGINSGQLKQFQDTLVLNQDYFYMPSPGAGMACNFSRVSVIQRLAQTFPTMQAQQMAQEVTAFMGAQFAAPAALPSSSAPYAQTTVEQPYAQSQPQYSRTYWEQPQQGYQKQYAQAYAQMPQNPTVEQSLSPYSDPRVIELGGAIAQQVAAQIVPTPQQTAMTQADLLNAARTLQSDAVGYMEKGFNLAATAQHQTADAIRKSRPNVTTTTNNTSDNRAYSVLDYVSNPLNSMGRLQFGILISAIFCVACALCFATLSVNESNQRSRYAPTSIYRDY